MTLTVEVRYYTDPACTWSWGSEPKVRKLVWEFDGELSFRWRPLRALTGTMWELA